MIIKEFGQGFYAVLSFAGQQYFKNQFRPLKMSGIVNMYRQTSESGHIPYFFKYFLPSIM